MTRMFRSIAWTGLFATMLAAGAPDAWGFDFKSLLPSGLINGTPPPAPEAPSTPAWSGQSGASGHPAMRADAIRTAAAQFQDCLDGLSLLAAPRGISRAEFAV